VLYWVPFPAASRSSQHPLDRPRDQLVIWSHPATKQP